MAQWDKVPIYLPRMTAELFNAVKDKDWLLASRNYRAWYDGIWEFDGAGQFMSNSIGEASVMGRQASSALRSQDVIRVSSR